MLCVCQTYGISNEECTKKEQGLIWLIFHPASSEKHIGGPGIIEKQDIKQEPDDLQERS